MRQTMHIARSDCQLAVKQSIVIACLLAGAGAAAAEPAWVDEARSLSQAVPRNLLASLTQSIAASGTSASIAVCQVEAPRLARSASQASGWNVRRVSLRQRNPKASPDDWEREALEDFDRRAAAGEAPATLERAAVVGVGAQARLRYIRALPTQPLCLNCHGQPEQMDPAVRDEIARLYPNDRAVGYAVGQIRGAVTLSKLP